MGRCREHNNVRRGLEWHLSRHCSSCEQAGCEPLFDECLVVSRRGHVLTREAVEAAVIGSEGDKCIISVSVLLSKKLDSVFRHPIVNIPMIDRFVVVFVVSAPAVGGF